MLDRLLGLVAPHLCCGCGEIGAVLCDNCKSYIIKQPFSNCLLCAQPAQNGVCLQHETTYQQAWLVGERRAVLQRVIGNLKFQNMRSAAGTLAELFHARIPHLSRKTVIVPIPTASTHIRERGYDHALLLARQLGRLRGWRVENILERQHNKTQHHANRRQRFEQAATAFRVLGRLNADVTYLILDDIVTTGASLEHAARALKDAGAQRIVVAALARQPLD